MDDTHISPVKLREVVLGRDRSLPRIKALALLLATGAPDLDQVFESVLQNTQEPAAVRCVAALSLGRLGTAQAEAALIRNSQADDSRVLAEVLKALGRIGGAQALAAINRVKQDATGLVAAQGRFAAALISYRLGLAGNDLPLPASDNFLALPPSNVLPIQVSVPTADEADLCLRSLAAEPVGLEFDKDCLCQLRCGQSVRMVLLAREFTTADAALKLARRKALLGVVATRFVESEGYAISLFIFTAPAGRPNALNILLHRSTGVLDLGGTGQIVDQRATLIIRAVSRPGAAAVQLEATLENGLLSFQTAVASAITQPRRQPRQILPAAF